YGYPLLYS
ncbi:histidine kinase-, DNA gyrase B-, and HSP90-like ATPase family protein, partial [Vibrio harveyi]